MLSFQSEIEAVAAMEAVGPDRTRELHALIKARNEYEKEMAETIARETRALLKERFPYPIFLYEAEKVGITATGDEDQNELCRFPKNNPPPGIIKTCLELHQEFLKNPKSFFILEEGR